MSDRQSPGAPPTVLVIEDDIDLRDALTDVLEQAGFEVSTAREGADGLRMLRGGLVPDAIVLDLMMPVMDGYAFREAQLADPAMAHIPVVVSTADRRAGQEKELPGIAALVSKPMSAEELIETLHRIIGARG